MKNRPDKLDALSGIIKGVGTGIEVYKLAKVAIFAVILIIMGGVLLATDTSRYIGIGLIVLAMFLIGLQIASLWRLTGTKLDEPATSSISFTPRADEALRGTVAGIMRIGASLGGYSLLGTGRIKATENALLVTDRNILAVTVPLPGAGRIMSGTNISMWQWLMSAQKIKDWLSAHTTILSEMLNRLSVNQITSWSEIEKIDFDDSSQSVIMHKLADSELRYSIRDKDEYTKAKELFKK